MDLSMKQKKTHRQKRSDVQFPRGRWDGKGWAGSSNPRILLHRNTHICLKMFAQGYSVVEKYWE